MIEPITKQDFQSYPSSKGRGDRKLLSKALQSLGLNEALTIEAKDLDTKRPQYYHIEKKTGMKFTQKKIRNENKFAILRIK